MSSTVIATAPANIFTQLSAAEARQHATESLLVSGAVHANIDNTVSQIPANITVLEGFSRAWNSSTQITDDNARKIAQRRLACGSVKRSRVEGVNTPELVAKLIKTLDEPMTVLKRPDKNTSYRFEVPDRYKAYSPLARVKDLVRRGGIFADGIRPCALRKQGNNWEYRLHAPKIYPMPTEVITFVLNEAGVMVEWYAGEDVSLWPANSDLGTHWVFLGEDLVQETIKNRARKTH